MNKNKIVNIFLITLIIPIFGVLFLIPSFKILEKTMQKTKELYSVYRNWYILKSETVIYISSERTKEDKDRFIDHVKVFDRTIEYLLDQDILAVNEKKYSYVIDNQVVFLKDWQNIQLNLVKLVSGQISIGEFADSVLIMTYETAEFDLILETLIASTNDLYNKNLKKSFLSLYILIFSLIIVYFLFILKNIEYIHAKKAEKKIRNLSQSIETIRDDERKRIALDLHDSLIQKLFSLKSKYSGNKNIKDNENLICNDIDSIISQIREISFNLRPIELEGNFIDAIQYYLNDISEKKGLFISFISFGFNKLYISDEIEINVFRIIQEIINNSIKHSFAKHVSVKLIYSFPYIILNVLDDGIGIDDLSFLKNEINKKHMGIAGIRDRVDLLNGIFKIKTAKDNGVKIFIKIPYDINSRQGNENVR